MKEEDKDDKTVEQFHITWKSPVSILHKDGWFTREEIDQFIEEFKQHKELEADLEFRWEKKSGASKK